MKIALPAPYDLNHLGGVESYILNLARAFSLSGHEVTLYTNSQVAEFSCIPLSEAEKHSADLVITQAIHGTCPVPKCKRRIHIFHGTILGNWFARPWLLLHRRFWGWFLLEVASSRSASGVVAVSTVAQSEVRMMGYRGPICQIPSGGGFLSERGTGRCLDDQELRAVFCGRGTDKVKRFSWLLAGVMRARHLGSPWRLYVLGDAGTNEVFPHLVPLGRMQKTSLISWYRKADIQLNASYYEGCSLAIAEGMFTADLPALTTPVGGNLNQVIAGQNGDFFQNPRELGDKLACLGQNRDLLQSYRLNLQSFCPVPSWEDVAKRILQFSETLS